MYPVLIRLTILLVMVIASGCGPGDHSGEPQVQLSAPVIQSTTFNSLYFTALNPDPSQSSSLVYRYKFSEGKILLLGEVQSRNPLVRSIDTQAIIFNRHASGPIGFRLYPHAGSSPWPELTPLTLKPGDPWDIESISNTKILLSTPYGTGFQTLDLETNALEELQIGSSQFGSIIPFDLIRFDTNIFAIQRGYNFDGTPNQNAALHQLTISGDTVELSDSDPATPEAEAIELSTTNAASLIPTGGPAINVVSICPQIDPSCEPHSLSINSQTKVLTKYTSLTSLNLIYLNEPIEGTNSKEIYVHAQVSGQESSSILKINIETATLISEIYKVQTETLVGYFHDPSSQTLLVGDKIGTDSVLMVFQNDALVDQVTLSGVPYNGSFETK